MKRLIILLSAMLILLSSVTTAATEELLEPQKAFELKAWSKDKQTIIAQWKIADGYFMYRNKFSFESNNSQIKLGEPILPEGKIKHDEFFGDVEIYRNQVSVEIPLSPSSTTDDHFELKTLSQGCADIGVCYPPLTQLATVTLVADGPASHDNSDPLKALKDFANDLNSSGDDFLDPDQAFQFDIELKDASTLTARWRVAEGYYLYRDKFEFELKDTEDAQLGPISLAKGKTKEDQFFGKIEIFDHDIEVELPFSRTTDKPISATLVVRYQGCATAGICYPPINKSINLTLPEQISNNTKSVPLSQPESSQSQATSSTQTSPSTSFQSEQDRIANTLSSGKGWVTVLAFYGFGLLLAFTPCVFPMIPILSGIIVGQGRAITIKQAFRLSLVYVLAMAVTYTVAGVLVGLSGENIQAWFQNPWVLSIFAGIFFLLALSMFGFYELQMPNSIQSRLTQLSNKQQGGTLVGAAIMGFLSALIVGPCVTAPLIGALIYIADTGDALLGGVALFSLSMGMGTPLLVIGTSAGKLLPKAGHWMDATKAVFGVLLIGVGIWLLERILPIQIIMALSGILLIVSAIYMGAVDAIKPETSGWYRLWKGMGLVIMLYGFLLLVGAASGSKSILQPLKGIVPTSSGIADNQHTLKFEQIKGMEGLKTALAAAQRENKTLMLDLYADWCISCKEMEAYTFTDPKVQAALNDVKIVQADVTHNDEADQALLKELGLFGPPAILFYERNGEERRPYRVVGFMPADKFSEHILKTFGQDKTL